MKRNLYNFSLLFASNMENLVAFMVQGYIHESLLHFIEVCLGMVYLFAVLYNLYWFLKPLADREEFDAMSRWTERRVDRVVDAALKPFLLVKRSFGRLKTKAGFAKSKPSPPMASDGGRLRTVMAAMRFKKAGASAARERETERRRSD
jgi:hypothetical protein